MCHLNRPSCGWPVEMFVGKWRPVWHGVVQRLSSVLRPGGDGYCPEASFDGCVLVTLIPLLSKNS